MDIKEIFKKNKTRSIILVLLIIIFLSSLTVLIVKLIPKKNDLSKKYKNKSTSSVSENLPDNPIDFKTLKADNSDVIAWIKVDGTVIDYPILMSSFEKEEDYYINHDMNLESKKAGSIYVQKINSSDFSDFNTLVYGHNMANGSMFGTLKKFRNKTFFKENRNIYIYAPKHIYKYEIVSAFIHDDRHIINTYALFTEEGRKNFAEVCMNPNTLAKNVIDNISVTTDDKLVTLSTCTSAEHERYLVVGKLVEDTKTK